LGNKEKVQRFSPEMLMIAEMLMINPSPSRQCDDVASIGLPGGKPSIDPPERKASEVCQKEDNMLKNECAFLFL
jgi:hypothetical protein